MKKILILLLIALFLVGCGEKATDNNDNDVKADVDVKKDTTQITTEDGSELVVSNDLEDSVPLPEDYPKDILPVYEGAHVFAASKNADGSFMVMAATNDTLDDLKNYYKSVLEESEVTMEQSSEQTYLNMGNLKGVTYTISISASLEDIGYEYSFTLIVMPELEGFGDDESSDTDESNEPNDAETAENNEVVMEEKRDAEFFLPETVSWPEDYPEETLPLYTKSYLEAKLSMAQGTQTMVALMSEATPDELLTYYSELLKEAEGYSVLNLEGAQMIQGTVDGTLIMVMIIDNDETMGEDLRFKTLIQIVY